MYSKESKVRRTGSFIYEEFMPTDGTDVKVYTVGPEYAMPKRESPLRWMDVWRETSMGKKSDFLSS